MGEHFENKGTRPSAIVVGAGAGGVATAARLAAAGYKVTVVEKNDFTGGRCSLIHRRGYVSREMFAVRCTTGANRNGRGSTKARAYYSSPGSSTKHSRI
jgi:monoamine oxidase